MRLNILAFLLGVLCLQCLPELPSPLLWQVALTAGLLVPLLSMLRGSPANPALRLLVAAACLLAGFGWAAMRAELRLTDALPLAWEGRDIEVVGVIAELPQAFANGERFSFAVERVLTPGAIVPERISLSWYRGRGEDASVVPPLRAGERWRLGVRLKRPHGNANPHGFDYEAWLLERGLRATGYVRPALPAQRLDAFVAQPAYAVERLRQSIRDRFLASLPDAAYGGVLVALVVGDQRAIQGELWNVFSRTGTTHLMSISGLHVTMVAALFGWLVGRLWRRSERLMLRAPAQRAAVLAAWLAALGYALLSGFSVPAQRTFFMLSAGALAVLAGRRTSPSRTLSLALLAVLLPDPWAVLAPGFWLSFAAVALLFYIAVERVDGTPGWRGALGRWGVAQWAVTIGSLPILLLFFQQFSLVSPLANAFAIPAVSFLITPLALLAAVMPLPGLLQLDHWLLEVLMLGLTWLADWPVLLRPAPPLWAVLIGLVGVACLLLPRGFPARWLGVFALLPALLLPAPRPPDGEARVTVLDVGQGLAVLVQTAGHALLYDTGPLYSAESDAGQRVVVPYLRALGVERIDTMVVTHRDSDHSGGAASVVAALPVVRTLSSLPEIDGDLCSAGQTWEWDGVRFTMLYPFAGDFDTASRKPNNLSCVLMVEAGDRRLLLTSDIEARDEARLLAADSAALRADILLVPHHGSRTSSTPDFIRAVSASDVIYPVGYRNRFGHPKEEILSRYVDTRGWRSDRDGAIEIRLGVQPEISAWRTTHRRYWHGH